MVLTVIAGSSPLCKWEYDWTSAYSPKNEAGGERIKVLLKKKEDVAERVKRGC